MIAGLQVAESLGCRALKDGLLCAFYLLAAACSLMALIYAVPKIVRFFDDRTYGCRKQNAFCKGVKR